MTRRIRAFTRAALARIGLETVNSRRQTEERLVEARVERADLKNKLRRLREVRDDQARVGDALTVRPDMMLAQHDLGTGHDPDAPH